jgi:hypothetical protein
MIDGSLLELIRLRFDPRSAVDRAPNDLAITRVQLELAVEVHVQAGEPWETAADAVATAAHAVVLGVALPGEARVVSMFQLDEAVSGDASPGMRSLNYAIEFFRSTAALDAAP